jgi:hypothetical protein
MKTLMSAAALKIIENNFSDESIFTSGAVLKKAFVMEGFTSKEANQLAIDSLKIVLKTISKLK